MKFELLVASLVAVLSSVAALKEGDCEGKPDPDQLVRKRA